MVRGNGQGDELGESQSTSSLWTTPVSLVMKAEVLTHSDIVFGEAEFTDYREGDVQTEPPGIMYFLSLKTLSGLARHLQAPW